jgi:hypothetical protein
MMLGLISLSVFGANTFNKEVDAFKEGLQTKIEADIKNFLGKEGEFDVIVTANLLPEEKSKEVSTFDIGYLPRPFQKDIKETEGLRIKSLSVKVYVYSKVDAPSLKFIKTLVQNHVQGFKADISAQEIVRSIVPPVVPKVEISWWDKFTGDTSNVLKLLGYIVGVASLIFFLVWFKNITSLLSGNILNTMKQIAGEFRPNPTKLIDRKEEIASIRSEDEFYFSLFERNLNIIQKTNLEIPDCLESCIGLDNSRDLKGLRSLIPFLGHESHVHIRYNISHELSNSLLNMKDETPLTPKEFYRWVNNFSERLSVLRIKSATLFERLLPADIMTKLRNIQEGELLESAKKMNQTMVWKIVFEILPYEKSQFLIQQLDEKDMKIIFRKESLKKSEVIKQAQQLLQMCTKMDSIVSGNLDVGILKPIMTILESKRPGEDDLYLESLAEYSAEIIPLVQANIWTSKKIKEVPSDILKEKFLSLDIDQKTDVLMGFKDIYGELFISFVQDAKLKAILQDKMKRSDKMDPESTKQANRSCRSFLMELKKDHEAGVFELSKAS